MRSPSAPESKLHHDRVDASLWVIRPLSFPKPGWIELMSKSSSWISSGSRLFSQDFFECFGQLQAGLNMRLLEQGDLAGITKCQPIHSVQRVSNCLLDEGAPISFRLESRSCFLLCLVQHPHFTWQHVRCSFMLLINA